MVELLLLKLIEVIVQDPVLELGLVHGEQLLESFVVDPVSLAYIKEFIDV
jgi:hypothetical protein